ncbi:MAG: glycerophosphodiester phosphodiesterase family protein [Clostridiales bacterium]|nr:glycerophosphodiester phosphodiesterase family protein [Clostridiales bacterium]
MQDLIRDAAKDRILIAAHRGASGGNIPCNSMAAFEAALYQGADIIELDITKSLDGELFVFHPGLEKMHLGIDTPLGQMKAADIKKLRYRNGDGVATEQTISTLSEVFEAIGQRCFINLDKFWDNIEEISHTVRKHNMQDRVIAKSFPEEECIDMLEKTAPDIPYLPFVWDEDEYTEELLERDIRLIGIEAHFYKEDSQVADPAYIKALQAKNLIVWANAIVFNYRTVESAGFTDDISMSGNPAAGWGQLAKRGFNIIQTDWVLPMRAYLQDKGYLK